MSKKRGDKGGLVSIGKLLPQVTGPLPPQIKANIKADSSVGLRLIQTKTQIRSDETKRIWTHSAFCQVSLPLRDPGDEVREWEKVNGNVRLKMLAGEALNPETGEWVKVGLPWGPKVRVVRIYLDNQAVTKQSPIIETDDSLTAFIREKLKLRSAGGRTIDTVKDALARLAASSFRIGIMHDGHAVTLPNVGIVKEFDIWLQKDSRQRVLFPSFVHLNGDYYSSLIEHAVPLLDEAVAALAHNAMALDIYCWLAQRLHRVPKNCPTLLFWNVLHGQFGSEGIRLADFRTNFKNALAQVIEVYPQARARVAIDDQETTSHCKDGRGLWLYHAEPPVKKVQIVLPR